MRLDKFLKVSRLIKRRTVANEACDAGRVTINGKPAKASAAVKEGDILEIGFGTKAVLGLEHHFSHIKREHIRYPRDGRASAPLHGQPVCSLHLDLFFFHKALSVYALDKIYERDGRNIHRY